MLLVAGVAVQLIGHREESRPERTQLTAFPLAMEGWQANEGRLDTQVEVGLGVDDYLLADYRRGGNEVVNFYVAYYGPPGKGGSAHPPHGWLPGGGGRGPGPGGVLLGGGGGGVFYPPVCGQPRGMAGSAWGGVA